MKTCLSDKYHMGKGLKAYITREGIKQRWLADRMGVSPQMLCQWFNTRDMRMSSALRICNGLSITLEKLAEISIGILDSK